MTISARSGSKRTPPRCAVRTRSWRCGAHAGAKRHTIFASIIDLSPYRQGKLRDRRSTGAGTGDPAVRARARSAYRRRERPAHCSRSNMECRDSGNDATATVRSQSTAMNRPENVIAVCPGTYDPIGERPTPRILRRAVQGLRRRGGRRRGRQPLGAQERRAVRDRGARSSRRARTRRISEMPAWSCP